MRLFLGMFATIDSYPGLREKLQVYCEGKWVEEENLHVTLGFLGDEIDPNTVIKKVESLPQLDKPIPIEGIRIFGENHQVLYGSLSDTYLNEMNGKFQALFELKSKPFHPHVTLCRIKSLHENINMVLEAYRQKKIGCVLGPVCLIQSTLNSRGPTYTVVHTF